MNSNQTQGARRVFDPDLILKAERAELSEETAKEVLLEIAGYLGRGEPLPIGVGEWFAGAIEGALKYPENYTHPNEPDCDVGQALLTAFGLRSKGKRKSAFEDDVYRFMNEWMDIEGCNQTAAAKEAAAHFNISVSSAQNSYRTIASLLKKAGLLPE